MHVPIGSWYRLKKYYQQHPVQYIQYVNLPIIGWFTLEPSSYTESIFSDVFFPPQGPWASTAHPLGLLVTAWHKQLIQPFGKFIEIWTSEMHNLDGLK